MKNEKTETMTPRERVYRAVHHQETDRVPIDFDVSPSEELFSRMKKSLRVTTNEEVLRRLNIDLRNTVVFTSAGIPPEPMDNDRVMTAWGVPYHARYGTAVEHPLGEAVTFDQIDSCSLLDPDKVDYDRMDKLAESWSGYCVYGGYWSPITYIAQNLLGMDRYMMLFYEDPELLDFLLDKITDIALTVNKRIFGRLKDKMQIFFMGDDYGTQESLLTSIDFWRRRIKPRIGRIIDLARNEGYLIQFHSCGCVAPLIPDFIELGVQILNPVQVSAKGMDLRTLKSRFGGKIAFNGGIDTQELLPFGTPEEVAEAAVSTLKTAAPGGGYVFAPSQSFLPEVPTENILALYRSAYTHAWYG
jgi:uroporphyrinogen decarboxylase